MSLPYGLVPYETMQDSTFGRLEFTQLEAYLISTPHFQTLRNVKQLGVVPYYFPNATGSRFDHSLVVCYLAGECLYQIHRHHPHMEWFDEWYHWVRFAGLVHDWAHSVFSHLFDSFLELSPTGQKVAIEMHTHESRGVLLLKHFLLKCPKELKEDIMDYEEIIDIIADLIQGVDTSKEEEKGGMKRYVTNNKGRRIPVPLWLFDVVANKSTELCVDKMAYLTVDSIGVGTPVDLEIARIFSHTRICPTTQHLIWSVKVAHNIAKVFSTRRQMHAKVYTHPQVMKYDILVMDLFEVLFRVFEFDKLLNEYNTNDHKWRLLLTDSMVWSLIQSVLFQPEWIKPVSVQDRTQLQTIWNLFSNASQISIVEDYETKETSMNYTSVNGTMSTERLQEKNQDSIDEKSCLSSSKNYAIKTMHAKYSYANSSFHPADKIRLYLHSDHLEDTILLRDAPAFQLFDMDVNAKPVYRTVVYRFPLK
ncbi:MAG: hypothetical protein Sylvanvirus4_42 [Sylvanvirus sp.]|uniref:Uncharacterized protein n=1 Tax=Sylvanvirus sp. TaxID=2487774 RepID=A0A3G5AHK8_9VIRU|nr:MAG: hypothetical protein Sylvanvirus4_42 [Sylvanvirus sp.]